MIELRLDGGPGAPGYHNTRDMVNIKTAQAKLTCKQIVTMFDEAKSVERYTHGQFAAYERIIEELRKAAAR